jgi:hypothetical protein
MSTKSEPQMQMKWGKSSEKPLTDNFLIFALSEMEEPVNFRFGTGTTPSLSSRDAGFMVRASRFDFLKPFFASRLPVVVVLALVLLGIGIQYTLKSSEGRSAFSRWRNQVQELARMSIFAIITPMLRSWG